MSTKDKDEPLLTGGDDDRTGILPQAPLTRVSSSDASSSSPTPRAARFGEGDEGSAARRERGKSGAHANFFERTSDFVTDTRAEMRRVSWPSATEVKNTTIITIVAVIFFAAYLFVVDRGLTLLIEGLTNLVSRIA